MPENVDHAREEIEAHIALRTGGIIELTDENDFHANGTDVGFDLHHGSGGSGLQAASGASPPPASRPPGPQAPSPATATTAPACRSASTDSYSARAPAVRRHPRAWRTTAPQPSAQLCSQTETTTTTAVDTPTLACGGEASVPSPTAAPSFRLALDPLPGLHRPGRPFSGASSSVPGRRTCTRPSSPARPSASSSAASSSSVVFPWAEPVRPAPTWGCRCTDCTQVPAARACPCPFAHGPGAGEHHLARRGAQRPRRRGPGLRCLCQWAGGAAAGGLFSLRRWTRPAPHPRPARPSSSSSPSSLPPPGCGVRAAAIALCALSEVIVALVPLRPQPLSAGVR